MSRRITLVVALVVLAVALPGTFAVAENQPEDLCAFLPDGAAVATPRFYGDSPACVGSYRPNDHGAHDASVTLFGFTDQAAATAALEGTLDQWATYGYPITEIDVGDLGAEWDARGGTNVPDYTWAFVRGPVMVWVETTTSLVPDGADLVVDLARGIDARLMAEYPGEQATTTSTPPTTESTSPVTTTEPGAPSTTQPATSTTTDSGDDGPDFTEIGEEIMVAALDPAGGIFGDAELELWGAVADATGCSFQNLVEALALASLSGTVPEGCRNAADRAGQAIAALTQDAAEAFPDLDDEGLFPMSSTAQSQAALHAAVAVYLANLDAPDGTALFPGIRAAEPVIMILGRGGVLGVDRSQVSLSRFVSLTIGRDVLAWENGT